MSKIFLLSAIHKHFFFVVDMQSTIKEGIHLRWLFELNKRLSNTGKEWRNWR
jgi:hypothetical protein